MRITDAQREAIEICNLSGDGIDTTARRAPGVTEAVWSSIMRKIGAKRPKRSEGWRIIGGNIELALRDLLLGGSEIEERMTPDAVADEVVQEIVFGFGLLGERGSVRILEPSCGDGSLASAIVREAVRGKSKRKVTIRGCDTSPMRPRQAHHRCYEAAGVEAPRFDVNFVEIDFMHVEQNPSFDLVIMSPPESYAAEHVAHARGFVKRKGKVVVVTLGDAPPGAEEEYEVGDSGYTAAIYGAA